MTRVFATFDVFWIPRESKLLKDTLESYLSDLRRITPQKNTVRSENIDGRYLETGGVSDVVSASWSKSTTSAGVLSISLRPSKNYLRTVRSGDLLVAITSSTAFKRNELTLCVCLVDSVREDTSVEEGVTARSYHVSSRDFTKILLSTRTVISPSFGSVNALSNVLFNNALLEALTKSRGGSPVEMVLTILDLFYNADGIKADVITKQWQMPSTGASLWSLVDISTFVQAPMFGYAVPSPIDPASTGNVWNMLTSLSNSVLNEFFIDVRDVADVRQATSCIKHAEDITATYLSESDVQAQKNLRDSKARIFSNVPVGDLQYNAGITDNKSVLALVFRQYPYDTGMFNKLPVHTLHGSDCHSIELTSSDHDVFNQFKIRTPSLPTLEQEYLYGLKINQRSQQIYGIKEYDGETLYPFASSQMSFEYDTGGRGNFSLAVYDFYVGILSVWYAFCENMLSGSVSCVYRPDIRVGNKLRLIREVPGQSGLRYETIDAYIQGVSQSFSITPGSSNTSVTLVRGVVVNEDTPENNLYWTASGAQFLRDPYVVFGENEFLLGLGDKHG